MDYDLETYIEPIQKTSTEGIGITTQVEQRMKLLYGFREAFWYLSTVSP
ncbi:hypothetical protein VJ786_02385 [Sphingobacterium sp. PU5-4]|uniref:Uncharacterized protein n=1 Tax=Sphingobacterium tenebrionis TaxID=3111775 RepID=A0ABU8I273_9SPHI